MPRRSLRENGSRRDRVGGQTRSTAASRRWTGNLRPVDSRRAGRVSCPHDLAQAIRRLFPEAPAWTRAYQTQPGPTVHVRVAPTGSGSRTAWSAGSPSGRRTMRMSWRQPWHGSPAPPLRSSCGRGGSCSTRCRHVRRVRIGLSGPGPGSGKSTLVADLLAAWFRYVNDDITVVDPGCGILVPYATSLCIKEGSWEALMPLQPLHQRFRVGGSVSGCATSSRLRRRGRPVRSRSVCHRPAIRGRGTDDADADLAGRRPHSRGTTMVQPSAAPRT